MRVVNNLGIKHIVNKVQKYKTICNIYHWNKLTINVLFNEENLSHLLTKDYNYKLL